MKRLIPSQLLDTLVLWLQNSWFCIKWKSVFAKFLKLDFGVGQSSPHLFAIYVDDLTDCCSFGQKQLFIMYTDIILIAPSVGVLQKLLSKCEPELLLVRNVN